MQNCSHGNCSCSCHSAQNSCCSCQTKNAQCHHGEEHQEMMGTYFLEVADTAWGEVLKDEIKKYILSTQKDRMADLAKIGAEANNHRWKNKMEKKQSCADFGEKLYSFFSKSKK